MPIALELIKYPLAEKHFTIRVTKSHLIYINYKTCVLEMNLN
jgi:hypothetical protein